MPETAVPSWTPGSCGPARAWGSGSRTRGPPPREKVCATVLATTVMSCSNREAKSISSAVSTVPSGLSPQVASTGFWLTPASVVVVTYPFFTPTARADPFRSPAW